MEMLARRLRVPDRQFRSQNQLISIPGVEKMGTYTLRGAPVNGAPQPYEG